MNRYRKEILFLSYQKVKTKYLETSFGMAWALIRPLTFVFTFWLFFTVGMRTGNAQDGHPYLLAIFASYMPWFVMSEMINSGTGVIRSNAVLVKTIRFPVMSLPLVNVLSLIYVHIGVMIFVVVLYPMIGGISYLPNFYYFNFIYYWFTMIVFFTGLTFILSSLTVIIKDIGPLVQAIMQPLFWITPVLYTPSTPRFDLVMRLVNPLYYFIVGYKDTLLKQSFFWEEGYYNLYMWFVILIIYVIGLLLFKKIRPLMADMI